jgi:hypothetical protein
MWMRVVRLVFTSSALGLATVACSGADEASPAPTLVRQTLPDAGLLPRVDLVDEAVAALEAELGGPQQYFEINATPGLVNLIVSLNNGALAQFWVYLDGELSSKDEPQAASGFTFAADALDFQEDTVLEQVQREVPGSALSAFVVDAGEGGVVRYTVVVNSGSGGQLLAVLAADGAVLSVESA